MASSPVCIVPTWHKGTLFLPKSQTTLQDCPGNDSEQYPGKPGHVSRGWPGLGTRASVTVRTDVDHAMTKLEVGKLVGNLEHVQTVMTNIATVDSPYDWYVPSDVFPLNLCWRLNEMMLGTSHGAPASGLVQYKILSVTQITIAGGNEFFFFKSCI